jgi:N-acetylmuramoyl-L-alanine amidase
MSNITSADLNEQLKNLNVKVNLKGLIGQALDIKDQVSALNSSSLGLVFGSVQAGFESLTQTTSNPQGATTSKMPSIASLTPSGDADTVKTLASEASSKLESVTGSAGSTAAAMLDDIVVAGTPLAIAAALGEVYGRTPEELSSQLGELTGGANINIGSAISGLVGGGVLDGFAKNSGLLSGAIGKAVGGFVDGNLMKNLAEGISGNIQGAVLGSIPGLNNNTLLKSAVGDIISNNVGAAVDKLAGNIGIPTDLKQLADKLNINTKIGKSADLINLVVSLRAAGASQASTSGLLGSLSDLQTSLGNAAGGMSKSVNNFNAELGSPSAGRSVKIGSTSSNSEYDTDFSYVDSLQEMVYDLRSISRPVTTTIVHWTSNYINDNHIDAEIIKQDHAARGWETIGYHYIIRRDGSIQRGRSPNQVGAHASNSHNIYSIGISFVAGYNCPNGTRNPESYASSASINSAQWKAFDTYLAAFYQVYPGAEVWGHKDTDPDKKIDPGFDVESYIFNKFGKKNVSPQPTRTYTIQELTSRSF